MRADPSSYVSDDDVRKLTARGVDVRSIRGAAHSVWYSHFGEFLAAVPELFGERTGTDRVDLESGGGRGDRR